MRKFYDNLHIDRVIKENFDNVKYSPDWNRMSISAGYPVVFCPDHPRSWSTGYIHVHSLIAEYKYGRNLEKMEVVHHKDEDKFNYHPDNLEIKINSEHISYHERNKVVGFLHFVCPNCTSKFKRRKGKFYRFCSRRCNGLHQRSIQLESCIPTELVHGKAVTYSYHKCRCDECRNGNKLRTRERRKLKINGRVTQLDSECQTSNLEVAGSNPASPTIF